MNISALDNRYQYICDKVRECLPEMFSLKFVKEYDDAVVAICEPPDSHMLEGIFLIPKAIFAQEAVDEIGIEQIEDYSSWDKKLPEKYAKKPLKVFYVSK